METSLHQEMVKNAVQGEFKGKKYKVSTGAHLYPSSAEREYRRVVRSYEKIIETSLKEYMPEILNEYKREIRVDGRFDGLPSFEDFLKRHFYWIAADIEKKIAKFGLDEKLTAISKTTSISALREWKKAVKKTLGINIMDDYYSGDLYEQLLKQWSAENASKIKSIPNSMLDEYREMILDAYKNGKTASSLKSEINRKYGIDKRQAELLARDQISTLNAQLTKMQQTDAGVSRYKWSTSKDSRVRECHADLEGTIQSWDDPPEMWYTTKSRGIVNTGRFCHPGEDYCCRCVAIPVFDVDTVDVPMTETQR